MPDPNQNSNTPLAGNIPVQSDLPPVPPSFQGSTNNTSQVSDFFPPSTPTSPKKKFGNPNRIVATILGVLLLIGGIGAGIVLVLQPELLQQKAAVTGYCSPIIQQDCVTGCVPDAQGGHCKPSACGSGLSCSGSQITGGNRCMSGSQEVYCCPSGQTNVGGRCIVTSNDPCPAGLTCQQNPVDGGMQCMSGGTKVYCCAKGSTLESGRCVGGVQSCTSDSQCLSNFACNPGTHTCERQVGIGNCANNHGNCYVKSGIGIQENPGPDGIRHTCDGPHWTTCAAGYTCSNYDCVPSGGGTPKPSTPPTKTPTPPPGQTPTPTPTPTPGITAVCSAVKAYTSGWSLLSSSQLSGLKPGNNINFCVAGTTSGGSFDKAKFTINGSAQSETTTKRPNTNDYCQTYVIPTGVTTFTVTAQIHHPTVGWVGP